MDSRAGAAHHRRLDRTDRPCQRRRTQLEVVGQMRSVSLAPNDAPSMIAMQRVGSVFQEFKSNSSVMVVLETPDRQLGDQDHAFYDQMVKKLEADKHYVEHVQDF